MATRVHHANRGPYRTVRIQQAAAIECRVPLRWTAEQVAEAVRESFVYEAPLPQRGGSFRGLKLLSVYVAECTAADVSDEVMP